MANWGAIASSQGLGNFDPTPPPQWESGQLQQKQRQNVNRVQAQMKSLIQPSIVQNILDNRRMFPWMEPGTQAALGLAGMGPDHPATQQVAQMTAQQAGQTGKWGQTGQYTNGVSEALAAKAQLDEQAQAVSQRLFARGGVPLDAMNRQKQPQALGSMGGLGVPAQPPQQIPQASQPAAPPALHFPGAGAPPGPPPGQAPPPPPAQVNEVARVPRPPRIPGAPGIPAPHQLGVSGLGPGVQPLVPHQPVTSGGPDIGGFLGGVAQGFGQAAMGGVSAASTIAQGLSAVHAPGVIGQGLQTAGRAFALAGQTGNEIFNASTRGAYDDLVNVWNAAAGGESWRQAGKAFLANSFPGAGAAAAGHPVTGKGVPPPVWEQSQGLQAAQALVSGDKVDVGTGFFPNPQSKTGQLAAQAARESAPLVNGHAFTVGRGFANEIFNADTKPYNLLSGGIDAAAAVYAYPYNPAFKAASEGVQSRGLISGAQSEADVAAARAVADHQGVTADLAKAEADKAQTQENITHILSDAGKARASGQQALPLNGTDLPALRQQLQQATDRVSTLNDRVDAATAERDRLIGIATAPDKQAAGLANVWRKIVDRPTASEYLASPKGQQITQAIADTRQPWDVRTLLGSGNVTPDVAAELAATRTPGDAAAALLDHLGTDVRKAPEGAILRNTSDGSRYGDYVLGDSSRGKKWIDPSNPNDPQHGLDQADLWAKTVGVPTDERAHLYNMGATAQTPGDRYAYADALYRAGRHTLVDNGVPQQSADALLHLAHDRMGEQSLFNTADIVSDAGTPNPLSIMQDGKVVVSSPHLENEQLNRQLFLPDAQDLRSLAKTPTVLSLAKANMRAQAYTTELANLTKQQSDLDPLDRAQAANIRDQIQQVQDLKTANDNFLIKGGSHATAAVEKVVEGIMPYWKIMRLARLGWGLRVVGDGMLSSTANGIATPLNHPLHYLSILAGTDPESKLGNVLGSLDKGWEGIRAGFGRAGINLPEGPLNRALVNDATGAVLGDSEMLQNGMSQKSLHDWLGLDHSTVMGSRSARVLQSFVPISKDNPNFAQAWLEELQRLRGSEVAKGVLNNGPEDAVHWFSHGDGAPIRQQIASDPAFTRLATDDNLAREYVKSVADRIRYSTGDNPELLDYIRNGRLGPGGSSNAADLIHGTHAQVTPNDLLPHMGSAPDQIRARLELQSRDPQAYIAKFGDPRLDRAFTNIMYNLAPRWDNALIRSPAWKQLYWEDAKGGIPFLHQFADEATQTKLLDAARQANIDPAAIREMEATPAHIGAGSITDPVEAHNLASNYAAHQFPKFIHDLTSRGQFFQTFRNFLPFGEAFKQVLTRWARNVAVNPETVYRLDQAIVQGRQAGVFTKDPTTGHEVFTLPGSQWLTDKVTGAFGGAPVPLPLTGDLAGLSIVGNVTPGVGPTVTLPAAYMWNALGVGNHGAASDALSKVIFPYGPPQVQGVSPVGNIADQFVPNWMQWAERMYQTPEGSRQYASTYQATVDYLASSGRYNLHGPNAQEQMSHLLEDAKASTNALMVIRGGANFTSPAAVGTKPLIRDKNNKLQELSVVKTQYYNHVQADGSQAAFNWLMTTYGPNAFTVTEPWTVVNGKVPRTTQGWDWANQNKWVQDKAPSIYGLLAPESKGFDLTAYEMSFANGSRQPADARQRLMLANNRLAGYVYDSQLAQNPDMSAADKAALSKRLQNDYPGFKSQAFNPNQTPQQINQLKSIINDPRAKGLGITPTITALQAYFHLYDEAFGGKGAPGPKSAAAAAARDDVLAAAQKLYGRDKGFAQVWDGLLKYSFSADQVPSFGKAGGLPVIPPSILGVATPGGLNLATPTSRGVPGGAIPAPGQKTDWRAFSPMSDQERQTFTGSQVLAPIPGTEQKAPPQGTNYNALAAGTGLGKESGGTGGTWVDFAHDLLAKLGAPDTPGNELAMLTWMSAEQPPNSPNANFNPLNIQAGDFPHNGTAGSGQYNFPDWASGVQATADFLDGTGKGGSAIGPEIKQAFQSGADPAQILAIIQKSGWAGGGYGGGLPSMLAATQANLGQYQGGVVGGAGPRTTTFEPTTFKPSPATSSRSGGRKSSGGSKAKTTKAKKPSVSISGS